MRTEEEITLLMKEAISALHNIFCREKDLRVPETDKIMEMVYSFFFNNSACSIPTSLRDEYIEIRLSTHGEILSEIANLSSRGTALGDEEKETIH